MACSKVISNFEVLSAGQTGRRRDRSDAEKIRIVEESFRGHRQGPAAARRYGLSRSLLTRWRKEHRRGCSAAVTRHFFRCKSRPNRPRHFDGNRDGRGRGQGRDHADPWPEVKRLGPDRHGRPLAPSAGSRSIMIAFPAGGARVERGRGDGHAARHEHAGAPGPAGARARSACGRDRLLSRAQGRPGQAAPARRRRHVALHQAAGGRDVPLADQRKRRGGADFRGAARLSSGR